MLTICFGAQPDADFAIERHIGVDPQSSIGSTRSEPLTCFHCVMSCRDIFGAAQSANTGHAEVELSSHLGRRVVVAVKVDQAGYRYTPFCVDHRHRALS